MGLLILGLITMIIPIINIIALVGFFIYGGLERKSMLYNSLRYTNHDQKVGTIKALEMVG